MPTRPQRVCRMCPAIAKANGLCEGHQAQAGASERARANSNARGYNDRWRKYSKARLKTHRLCEVPDDAPYATHAGRPALASLTDHIVPHKGDSVLFWDVNNHRSSCDSCHSRKTAMEEGGFGNPNFSGEGGAPGGPIF